MAPSRFVSAIDLTTNKVTKCGDKQSKCCLHIVETRIVTFNNGKQFDVKYNMNCNSKELIYVITCRGCNQQYIGETGDTLRNRTRVHRQQINDIKTRQISLSEHIDKCSSIDIKFTIFPFYKLPNSDTVSRREKEKYFIKLFQPRLNRN